VVSFDPASSPSYDAPLPGPVLEPAPARRPGSIRRTSHVDSTRFDADGSTALVRVDGAARDLLTTDAGAEIRDEGSLTLAIGANGLIEQVANQPADPSCAALIGKRIGFGFRSGVKELLAEISGTPLGLLVDDLSGAPAPAGYGMIRERTLLGLAISPPPEAARRGPRADVCAGWRASGVAYRNVMAGVALPFDVEPPVAPDLRSDDPLGWHAMAPLGARQSRRIRRLDVWREGERLLVDAMFRDSTADPDLTPRVVHEYTLTAALDPATLQVLQIQAVPRALPFPTDCPFAADSAQLVVGQPVTGLRDAVRTLSAGPVSCTHLNDALRSLEDVGVLIRYLLD
jgi:hypothetical protein